MIVFSATFFVLLIVLFLVNRFFLVDNFISTNHENMRSEARRFIQEYRTGDREALTYALIKNTGGRLFLLTKDLKPAGYAAELPDELPFSFSEGKLIYEQAASPSDYFTVLGGGEPEDQMLLYAIVFGDGTLLVIAKAMGLVGEASRLFFRFMMLSSAAVYLVGLIIIFIISGRLSRPITELKRVTRKMASLSFDEKLQVKGGDEISELMTSVNQMADTLSETIRDLHASNEQLERELSKERSLETMRRRFVSDVSHELKNPISVILGYADGLVQNVPKTAAAKREYYGIIADEANGMNALVKNLLDLSSYESGSFTLQRETFSLNEMIDSALERFRYLSGEKNVRITYRPESQFELHADKLRIHQVIVNLLGNAFQYVDDGGEIRIELQQAEKRARMTIANTGSLIPQKDLELIWNSFYRVNTHQSGSGLGLAIVKSIVELHHGACRAYTLDGYNCFEVIL